MGLPDKWTKRFGISEADMTEWKADDKSEVDVLFDYLIDGKISETEYMRWASERFELPSIGQEFFSTPLDSVFWARIKSRYQWSASLLPIAQWDDVIVIACLQPPERLELEGTFRFVIAPATAMQTYWEKLQPKSPTKANPAPLSIDDRPVLDADAPQGLNVIMTSPSIATTTGETTIPQRTPHDSDGSFVSMPDGLVGTQTKIPASGLTQAMVTQAEEAKPKTDAEKLDEMGALDLPEQIGTAVAEGLLEKLKFGDNPFKTETVTSATLPTKKLEPPVDVSVVTVTANTEVVKPPPIPSAKIANPGKPAPAQNPPLGEGTSFGAAPELFAGKDPRIVQPRAQAGSFKQCENLDELAEVCLARVTETFDCGMILLFEGDGGLHPWKWTSHMASAANDDLPVLNLGVRSMFRIVNRTFLPYHGHVPQGQENDRFFAAFLAGKTPRHATLAPVMMKKQILGMLLGVSNTDLQYKTTLPKFLALSSELAENIHRLRQPKKKVAAS